MKPKYLVISEVFYPEEFLVNDFVFETKKQGFDVEVLTRTPSYPYGKTFKGYKNKIFQKEIYNDIIVNRVSYVPRYQNNIFFKILNYVWFIVSTFFFILFKGKKYTHYFVYQTGPLTVAHPGVLAKKIWKKKLIVYTQDVWPDTVFAYGIKKRKWLELFLSKYVRWVYKHTDSIIVSCKGFIPKIRSFVPDKDIHYIPNWIPESFNSKIELENIPEFYFGLNFTFAGNLGKVQNLENIILGFYHFVKTNKIDRNVYLNIVGDGSNLMELRELVDEKKIPNVIFWGRMSQSMMPYIFEQSDVLIISLIEKPIFSLTVPSKFQAYLSANKPILCAMKGEVADLVKSNNLGIVVSPSDIIDISNGFNKFSTCTSLEYNKYSEQIKNISKKDYDRLKNINNILSIFSNIKK